MADPETEMWYALKEKAENEPGRTVQLSLIAVSQIRGMRKQQACQIAKQWANRGLVVTLQNGSRVVLTEEGAQTTEP